ncbi:membrane protein [Rhodococcus sp. JVH1]|uniref:membrane protein n=1 Tax=Rhodococcus sp. JVH1 TaxID=745408 RepID=UPI0005C1F625|nr:membrane protein [Rhodococcus sp. JVH1]
MTTRTAPSVPQPVERAYRLLGLALFAGVVEALAHTSPALEGPAADVASLARQLVVRIVVYGAVLFVMTRFRSGRAWARNTLAIGLGVFGVASLVMEPITWMWAGNDPMSAVSGLTLDAAVIATARLTHLVAVIAAVALMFRPDANRYFTRR